MSVAQKDTTISAAVLRLITGTPDRQPALTKVLISRPFPMGPSSLEHRDRKVRVNIIARPTICTISAAVTTQNTATRSHRREQPIIAIGKHFRTARCSLAFRERQSTARTTMSPTRPTSSVCTLWRSFRVRLPVETWFTKSSTDNRNGKCAPVQPLTEAPKTTQDPMKTALTTLLAQLSLVIACQSAMIDNRDKVAHQACNIVMEPVVEAFVQNNDRVSTWNLAEKKALGTTNRMTPMPWQPTSDSAPTIMPCRPNDAGDPCPLALTIESKFKLSGLFHFDLSVRNQPFPLLRPTDFAPGGESEH
jgi:hypothetical protein